MRIWLFIKSSIVDVATLGALFSLTAVFSAHHLLFDLIAHFRVQYIILLAPVFILAMFARKTFGVLVISIALALHGYVVFMSTLPRSGLGIDTEYTELKVLSSNVLASNSNYDEFIRLVNEASPDVIAIQEYTYAWSEILRAALSEYPFRISDPRNDPFGIALYSKFEFKNISPTEDELLTLPTVMGEIVVDEKSIQIFSVHPPPPISQGTYNIRNRMLGEFAELAQAAPEHVIVMGDLNATPWTAHYETLTSGARLHNARAGHGLHPTWPDDNVLLQVPIDHILISELIRSNSFESKLLDGSDHQMIWSTLRIY